MPLYRICGPRLHNLSYIDMSFCKFVRLCWLSWWDHKTRRLASYVRVATIKLSRVPESLHPPDLAMIHPRYLPALLAHLPSLHDPRLRVGKQLFKEEELALVRRLSSIHVRSPTEYRGWSVYGATCNLLSLMHRPKRLSLFLRHPSACESL